MNPITCITSVAGVCLVVRTLKVGADYILNKRAKRKQKAFLEKELNQRNLQKRNEIIPKFPFKIIVYLFSGFIIILIVYKLIQDPPRLAIRIYYKLLRLIDGRWMQLFDYKGRRYFVECSCNHQTQWCKYDPPTAPTSLRDLSIQFTRHLILLPDGTVLP